MRHKGNIVEWHKARGFGFIEPETGNINGEDRIFCHIDAFQIRLPYPTPGLPLTFEVVRDERGRSCAANVIQEGAAIPRSKPAAAPAARLRRAPVAWGLLLLGVIALAALAWLALRR
jgi:cold shock CspA family protein